MAIGHFNTVPVDVLGEWSHRRHTGKLRFDSQREKRPRSRLDVLRMVLGEGVRLSGVGLAFGLAGAWLVGRAMHSLLFGVQALDLTAFSAVAVLLTGAALLACCVPARRAASVDPVVALRED